MVKSFGNFKYSFIPDSHVGITALFGRVCIEDIEKIAYEIINDEDIKCIDYIICDIRSAKFDFFPTEIEKKLFSYRNIKRSPSFITILLSLEPKETAYGFIFANLLNTHHPNKRILIYSYIRDFFNDFNVSFDEETFEKEIIRLL